MNQPICTQLRSFVHSRTSHLRATTRKVFTALLGVGIIGNSAVAQVPDLTAGGLPTDTEYINLGPTGMEGWIYNKGAGKMNETVDARQILVTKVDPGSPAAGILAVDDVILGVDGTGAEPVNFTSDARKALAYAIDDAEGNNPAILKLIRWRSGVTTTVSITLDYLGGSYTATAPYNCPKSAAILEKGIEYIMNNVTDTGYGGFAPTVLMAANDPSNPNNATRQARAQAEAYQLNLSQSEIDDMTSGDLTRAIGKPWNIGPQLITQAEYYLQTGDATVLPSIRARAIQIANAQSLFGTMGHHYSLPGPNGEINGPYGIGYGPVNNAGMPCFIGLILAEKCGLTDQAILDGISRAGKYFQYYADLGTVPYGENKETGSIANNGKSGLNAIALGMIPGYESQAKYFSKLSVFGASERDGGHTGPYFNQLWTPLGANYGGQDAMADYFNTTSWLYDLARTWDGDFVYHPYYQSGGIKGYGQGHKASWTTLLTYAAPLSQLYITGKNSNAAQVLDAADLSHINFAKTYDPTTRTTAQLIEDLKSPLPQLHWSAGGEIGANRAADHASILPTLIDMAQNGATYAEQHGAIFALGKIADDSTASVLAGLCEHPNSKVRYMAANALSNLSMAAKTAEVATIVNGLVTNDRPMLPLDPENPMHVEKMAFATLLFDSNVGIWGGSRVNTADRALFIPAFRIIAGAPMGVTVRDKAFSVSPYLTKADVEELADVLVDVASGPPPAEISYACRAGAIEAMQVNDFAEGVPASVMAFYDMTKNNDLVLQQLQNYAASSLNVDPDPEVIEFCKRLISNEDSYYFGAKYDDEAQAILDAIAADQLPEQLIAFKSVDWVFADQSSLTLPATSTVLRVKSTDLAKGSPFYTWRKVHGAGDVTFSPNGTASAKDTTVLFDGTPGVYTFEVTMADDKGLTEAYGTVTVTLNNSGGSLPPNTAPTANADAISAGQGTPTQVVLTGTDPEGQDLTYTVTEGPANGSLSGTAPYLVYTSDIAYTGADSITFEVMDTEGLTSTATVDITVDPVGAVGLALYEPFNYPSGAFNGAAGSSEIGLAGSWSAQSNMDMIGGSLNYGSLVTGGGSLTASATANSHAASRAITPSALAGNGLLDDGATMWFSAVLGHPGSNYNAGIYLALANDQFANSGGNHYIVNDGAQLGSGLGVWVNSATVYASHFQESAQGGATAGTWTSDYGSIKSGVHRLVVGKITWGATSDTIEIYLPWDDLVLPSFPSSSLTVNVDQSTYDTLTISRNGTPLIDEIRFGSTYQSVVQGTTTMVADTLAPTPNPMTFAVAPAPSSTNSISMTATPAFDALEVEYYFTCTAGGGNDSGWQDSNVYTDTGLTPGVQYSYTVKARDKHPGLNETAVSGAATTMIPVQGTVPNLVGILQSSAEDIVTAANLTVGNITTASAYSLTVPSGHVLSQTPAAGSSANYGSTVDLEISIGQDPALPTLAAVDIVDDQSGGPVVINTPMTYTLTFSEDIDAATLDAADFLNAGTATITIGSITETSPGVVTVGVTPTSTGILRFAVAEGATIQDAQGDAFNATSSTIDDTVITINLPDEVVPNVVGLAQATAESNITAANLVVGSINSIYDEVVPVGDVISQDPAGGSSIPGQSPVNLVISLGTPPDTTGPVLVTTDPVDGAYNVEANANLHVTFDEDVFVGTGNIVLRNLSDGGDTIIPVTDASQVSTQFNVLTIDPAADMVGGKSYAIRIAAGAVVDGSGNDFSGISDNTTWNFSTSPTGLETLLFSEDFEAPDVVAYSEGTTPASWVRADQGFGATQHGITDKAGGDFSAPDPNHQAYAFRYGNSGITTAEGVLATIAEGDTYEISFDVVRDDGANAGTPYTAQLIAFTLGDARNDCRSSAPGIDLTSATGNARTDGLFSTVTFQYTVAPGDPAIGKDLSLRFKGASTSSNIDNLTIKKVTNPNDPDQVPPTIAMLTPQDNALNVSLVDNLRIDFDEDIAINAGYITLKNLTTSAETVINIIDGTQVLVNGSSLEINPTEDLSSQTFYAVRIDAGAITDLSGNAFPGIQDDVSWTFNTGDIIETVPPLLVSTNPADNATGVSYSTSLTLSFDENVVANSGNITLKNLTDSTETVIDVTDSSQVVTSVQDVIITPSSYMGEGKDYAVQVDAGAILDLSGNAYAGIADDTTWNFTTSANNPPAIATLDPADEAVNVDIAANLNVTFDEDIAAGTGNIIIRNVNTSGELSIDVNDATQVSISGPTLTINPSADLGEATNYAILIDSGAIQDLAGNPFGGISSDATWNFVTGVSSVGLAFFDDFEVASGSPDVDASGSDGNTSKQTGPNWVRSTQAFGSANHGIVDESSGQFTDPGGEQAYAFRYTNSGITSAESAIGTLTAGKVYRVTFNVVGDGYNNGGAYDVGLVTFAAGAARTDVGSMGNGTSMVLASKSGNYSGSAYQLVSFEYISDGSSDAAVQGHDLAIRLDGASTSANIDNVQITINDAPSDVIAPTLAGSDIVDDQAGAAVDSGTLVTYTVTFSEDMDATTVNASDFSNAGTAAVTIGTVSETVPGVFSVQATPTSAGSLQLQVSAGATLTDVVGNALDTTSAIADDTTITVNAINNAPVAQADSVVTNEDTPVGITLVATDADSDPLSYQVVSGPTNGVLSGTAPDLTYTPNAAFSGSDSFTFKANDGLVDSNIATVSITVNAGPANNAPVASDDSVTTEEDSSVAITLVATDADSDPLIYNVVTGPANGVLSGTAPDLTYTPNVGYTGPDSFTFLANDGTDDSNIATISITVNAAPANGVVFADDFEPGVNPYGGTTADVTTYNLTNTSKSTNTVLWVRSSDGFGSDRNGLLDETENGGLNFTDPSGEQAYGFRYTNSGVTTAEGVIGALTAGTTIEVSFDVVMDGHNSGTLYDASLLLFDASAARNSVTNYYNNSAAVLAQSTGNATGDGAYTTVTFSYVVGDPVIDNDGAGVGENTGWLATLLGKDIALRFDGATTCANIDNVSVSITSAGGGDTTPPTLASSDIVDDAAGGPVTESTSVTYTVTFSEDMDGATVDVTDFGNAGTAAITVDSVTETTPGVFSVAVTPTNAGSLQLQVNAGSALKDVAGNNLDTASAILDDTTITVNGTNNAPVASDDSAITDEDTAVAITLVATDADPGDTLTYAVVTGPTSGVLSGTAPNLTYTPDGDYNGADSFTFKANDGTVDSNVATVSITVNAVNDAPVAANDTAVTNEDAPVAVTLSASDVDGNPLTYAVVSAPANGVLSGTAPNLTYTPSANFNGSDSFTFQANDGTVNSNIATVNLTVNSVDDAPVASNDAVSTDEDTAAAVTLVASDVDGDPLTYAVVTAPTNGTLSGTAPNLTYTPNGDYNGSDSFTFKATGNTVDSNIATVSITVNAVNDAPVASDDSATTEEDTAVAIVLAATDTEGDPLTYAVVSAPTSGTLSGTAPNLTYTPDADANGSDSFTFTANDGTADSNVATVSLTVNAVDDAPVADDQSVSTDEDTATAVTLVANDVDGDPLTYAVVTGPTNGTLSGTAPNLTYTPAADYNGSDSFTFKATGNAVDSNIATVSITVNAANDAPVASDDSATTDEDSGVAITLAATDIDAGDTLTYAVVTGPTNGTLSGTAPNLTYTPNGDYNGADSFTFKANDGTVDSNVATVSITVNAVNDAPIANDDSATSDEDSSVAITLTATDVDTGDVLTYAVVTGPANGTLSGTAPNLTYTPNSDYNGADSFTFTANDGTVGSNTATVSITVNAVNDAPVADDQSVATDEDSALAVTLTASDVDAEPLSYAVVTPPTNGSLSGTAPNLTYTPNADYNGSDSFTFVANDGAADSNTATISITVNAVNDAPIASDDAVTTDEDTAVAVTLAATDVDAGDTLTYAVVTGPTNGVLSGTAPNLTYTPNAGYNGADSLTFKANDGTVDSNIATVSITVNGVNNTPVASNDSVITDEDSAAAVTLVATDADAGDTLTYAVVSGPTNGVLSGTAPNLTYTPNGDYNGADSFTFKANDGTVDSNIATVSITVNAVNDAPVASDDSVTTEEDTAVAVTLSASDVDAGDTLTYAVVTGPTNGVLSGTAPDLTYTPNAGYFGPDSFTFEASDGTANSNLATVSITVNEALVGGVVFADDFEPGANPYGGTTPDVNTYTVGNTSRQANSAIWVRSGSGFGADRNGLIDESESGGLYFTDPVGEQAYGFRYTNSGVTTAEGVIGSLTNGTTINVSFDVVMDGHNAGTGYEAFLVLFDAAATRNAVEYAEKGTAAVLASATGNASGDGNYTTVTFSYVVGDPVIDNDGDGGLIDTTYLATLLGKDIALRFDGATTCANIDNVLVEVLGGGGGNTAPMADDQSVSTDEDAALAVTLTASDVDADPLTYSVVTAPANGTLSGTAPNLTYTPDADYNGSDSFTFTANDGTADSNVATISLTVNAVNDAPIADDQSPSTSEDTAVAVTLTANDVDGDALTYTVITAPTNGTLSGTAPNLTYTPNVDYNGSDSFTFVANDGLVDSNTATVSLTVTAVNDAPLADDQPVVTNEDTAAAVTLTASDVDGDLLTYIVVTGPANGTLSGTAPNLTYTPNADYNGSDSFTFMANDGTTDSNIATVSLTVNAVNDASVAGDQSVGTDEDTAVAITLTASDIDGDALTYNVVTAPVNGTLSGTAPNLTYTPNSNYNGGDSFTFKANDGTVDSNIATVSITVNAIDDAPVAGSQSLSTDEDTALVVTLTASDVEGDPLTYTVVTPPTNGTLSGTAPDLTYTPNANYNGNDSFTFKATGNSVDSNVATVSITVNSVEDLPVANNQSVSTDEDTALAVTLTASDADGDPLSYAVVTGPTNGTLSGTAPDLTYTPNADYNGSDSFTFTANDGLADSNEGTVTITVNAINDAPVFTVDPIAGADATENAVYSGTIAGSATDVDGDTLTYSKVSGANWLTVSSDGVLGGTPGSADVGLNVVTVNVTDGTATPVEALLNITVNEALTTVPNVVGLAQATAESNIVAADLVVGTITEEYSETVPVGDVISQGLTAGSSVAVGSAVDLVVSLGPPSAANLVRTTVSAVSNTAWTTVDLGQTYNSLVVVATPIYGPGVNTPVVTRINNVTATGFDLKVDRADGLTGAVSFDVSVIAVEEGVYTQANDGVTMEAVKFTSTSTAYGANNWVAEARTLQNSYTNLVVVGQVMSYNDTNWSTFFSMGATRQDPADAANFFVSKHVGQDPNVVRANETIGYIVIEAGNGTIDGVAYEAGVGADIVQCFGDSSTPYTYNLSGTLSTASAAAASQTGMDGNDGSWAVLSGSNPITPNSLSLHVAEDWLKDNREKHTDEQVGYIVFE